MVNGEIPKCEIMLVGMQLELVTEVKYLGHPLVEMITNDAEYSKKVVRYNEIASAIKYLKSISA